MKEGVSIMGKFCASCGTALNEDAKFCAKCGSKAFQSNESLQINTETPPETVKSEQEIPKTMNNTKNNPPIARASNDAPQNNPIGMGKFITEYINQSLTVLKNPKQMLPTVVLGLVWLVLALLGSLGINPLPVRQIFFPLFLYSFLFKVFYDSSEMVFKADDFIIRKAVIKYFVHFIRYQVIFFTVSFCFFRHRY
jgi:uncharacterized Zn finger protein (UPF0148 family)